MRQIRSIPILIMIMARIVILASDQKITQKGNVRIVPAPITNIQQSLTVAFPVSILSGERIDWQVISSGGNRAISPNFIVSGTTGQTAVGSGTSANFKVLQGFWQNFVSTFICGDANGNGSVNIIDVSYIINYLYKHGPAPNPLELADVNHSDTINVLDVSYLINFLYRHGSSLNCP